MSVKEKEEENEGWYSVPQCMTGSCNMNVCEVVSESMVFPHNHVLTLGLPVFCSAAPTLFLVKLWSTWRCEGPGKSPLSVNLGRFVIVVVLLSEKESSYASFHMSTRRGHVNK